MIESFNRIHAIFGWSEICITTRPSGMCVSPQAVVNVTGAGGERQIKFEGFQRLPGDTPKIDTNLRWAMKEIIMTTNYTGKPENRVGGKLKVTGAAV